MSKPHKVGPFTIRPKVVNGIDTGKWVLDIPVKDVAMDRST